MSTLTLKLDDSFVEAYVSLILSRTLAFGCKHAYANRNFCVMLFLGLFGNTFAEALP